MTCLAIPSRIGYAFAHSVGVGVGPEALHLSRVSQAPWKDRRDSFTLGWRDSLVDSAIDVFTDCQSRGWDGYGGVPISGQTLLRAVRFIDLLPEGIRIPEVVPEPDGDLGLEWRNDAGMILVVSFDDSLMFFAAVTGPRSKLTGTRPFSDEISKEVLDLLSRYFAMA